MSLSIVTFCLVAVVALYFYNNPLKHDSWFMVRRFINWFPLGMTYAFLYMGRYNLTVSKNAFGALMSKEDFGLIFAGRPERRYPALTDATSVRPSRSVQER